MKTEVLFVVAQYCTLEGFEENALRSVSKEMKRLMDDIPAKPAKVN